jgi:hypothetical protein
MTETLQLINASEKGDVETITLFAKKGRLFMIFSQVITEELKLEETRVKAALKLMKSLAS